MKLEKDVQNLFSSFWKIGEIILIRELSINIYLNILQIKIK